jgi:hypothetical protein
MPDRPRIPPSPETLARFLRERRSRPVAEVAALLGWSRAEVEQQSREQDALLGGSLVEWSAAAAWLVESWPLAALLEALGTDRDLLPPGLHLLDVHWQLPAYLVHALRVQAAIEQLPHRIVRPTEFMDYLADLLHRAIDPATVAVLERDDEFLRALDFPFGRW